MKESTVVLLVVLALMIGVLLGYIIAADTIHSEAAANGMGHYTVAQNNSRGTVFVWGK